MFSETITKRDLFVAAALSGVCANIEISKSLRQLAQVANLKEKEVLAVMAIEAADATLEKLKTTPDNS